jgi:hypothetical protein
MGLFLRGEQPGEYALTASPFLPTDR